MISQNQDKSFIYTFLDDFKKNPENSTPYLVVTLFDELLFKKGIILVRGDIIGDITYEEGQKVFNMTKDHYSRENLFKKVLEFNNEPRKFNHNAHTTYCLSNYF